MKKKPLIHRARNKDLGLLELIAIALGGMIGGGIFTVLGVSVAMVGVYTPLAFIVGGLIALVAAYSYVKLALFYKDEGATYSFFKRTFPRSTFAASLVGWWVTFGYISTLALYAYTFASYAISGYEFAHNEVVRKAVASGVILLFLLVNLWSVKGMGKIEDLMVYTKLLILVVISFVLMNNANTTLPTLIENSGDLSMLSLLIVASLTFVAFEGFQLVIHAMNEMKQPIKNIPRAIYSAIFITIAIYVIIALGAIFTIPFEDIIQNQEFALASGADKVLGHWGTKLVLFGALLATSSAISGTLFGASRLVAVIAKDGYFPELLARRSPVIPRISLSVMALCAISLILLGDLKVILEFGSITFLLVSFLMAYANFKMRKQTQSSLILTLLAMVGLSIGTFFILYYEATTQIKQVYFIVGLFAVLTLLAWLFSFLKKKDIFQSTFTP